MLERIKYAVSHKNRENKLQLFLKHLKPEDTIVDIGVDIDTNPASSTNYLEKWFKGSNRITGLGVYDDYSAFRIEYPHINILQFDGFHFPKFEKKFDMAFSNAVIEHVGEYEKQLHWLKEIRKLTNTLFITTPNRLCPFEAHTNTLLIHYFPKGIRTFLYKLIKRNYYHGNLWLLSKGQFKELLTEAGFKIEKIYANRIFFIPIDYVIVARSESS